jgi:cysteine-rich repeat protein
MKISKYFIKTLTALALMSPVACSMGGGSDQSALSGNGSGDDGDCTFTQGYWKNHPDAWPVSSLKLGTVTYTKAELIAILQTPVKGNGLIQLAHQLIAAKLNIAAGASDVDIKVTIQAADALIGSLVVGEAELPTSQTSALNDKLDAFNNGNIGPGHCDKDDDDDDDDCDHDDDGDCDGDDDDDDCDHDDDGDCDGDTAVCGNGVKEGAEGCDDGNTTNGDGCSSTCTVETHVCVCGDGVKDATEACDDGNTVSGDGCSSTCTIELPVCGDGVKAATEACDDGNTVNGDGCSSTCTIELPVCGNGVVETGETCDDGNTNNGDGCSSVCICEPCH